MSVSEILLRALYIVLTVIVTCVTLLGYAVAIRPLIQDRYILGAIDFGLIVFVVTAYPLTSLYLIEKQKKKKKS